MGHSATEESPRDIVSQRNGIDCDKLTHKFIGLFLEELIIGLHTKGCGFSFCAGTRIAEWMSGNS